MDCVAAAGGPGEQDPAPGSLLGLAVASKNQIFSAQVIIGMFPTNPIDAMASGNMLQVIVFALLFGIAMALSGDTGKRVAVMFEDLNAVILKLVTLLMNVAPYGVFCLMAKLFTTIELSLIVSLAKYFGVVVVAH